MALTEIEVRRINSYITALRADAWSGGPAAAMFKNSSADLGNAHNTFYYKRLDRFYSHDRDDVGGTDLLWWDPLALDASGPKSGYIFGADQRRIWVVGEWDKDANVQRIYGAINSGSNALTEVNSAGSTPDIQDTTVWPFAAGAQNIEDSLPIASGTNGSRVNGSGAMVLFETAGFALQPNVQVRHTNGTAYSNVLARIDLATGLSTIEAAVDPGFVVSFDNTPHIFQEPPIFGSRFHFSQIQFIEDDDSVTATPKGRLFLATHDNQLNLRFSGALGPGSQVYNWIMFVEFNPFGVPAIPGNPNRVHGRRLLLSRMIITEETEPESGGIGTTTSGDKDHEYAPWYHPPTDAILTWVNDVPAADNDAVLLRHSLAPVLSLNGISSPTAINTPETNKTVTFEVVASGDIGEPIASLDIDWTLQRASTLDEALDTAALLATSTVDNIPIDVGTLVVKRDPGTGPEVLVDPTHYTFVPATGVITWVGPHPNLTVGYSASYEHKTNFATPPHGALQTVLSRTNEKGVAQARVLIADDSDLVGQRDAIDGSQAT